MKHLFVFLVLCLLVPECQSQKTDTTQTTLQQYFDNSSLQAAVLGTIDKEGHATWYSFGPAV